MVSIVEIKEFRGFASNGLPEQTWAVYRNGIAVGEFPERHWAETFQKALQQMAQEGEDKE